MSTDGRVPWCACADTTCLERAGRRTVAETVAVPLAAGCSQWGWGLCWLTGRLAAALRPSPRIWLYAVLGRGVQAASSIIIGMDELGGMQRVRHGGGWCVVSLSVVARPPIQPANPRSNCYICLFDRRPAPKQHLSYHENHVWPIPDLRISFFIDGCCCGEEKDCGTTEAGRAILVASWVSPSACVRACVRALWMYW